MPRPANHDRRKRLVVGRIPRGVSVLMVLALLSMTLALAYSITRTGTLLEQGQMNYERLDSAREAAYAGLAAGLRRLKSADWGGVESEVRGTLQPGVTYLVSYSTGDTALTSESPDYAEFPYRLTVRSTGIAADATTGVVSTMHRVEAVVKFVPRKLTAAPGGWDDLQQYTLYQWGTSSGNSLRLDLPARIEGPVRTHNAFALAPSNLGDGDVLPFAGEIDEVAILGKALTADEILHLYQGESNGILTGDSHRVLGRWRFEESASALIAQDSRDNYDGLYEGGKPVGGPVPVRGGNGSLLLDGINDHVHLGAVDASGDELTILAWVRPTSFPSSAGRIVAKANGPDTDDQYWTLSHYLTNGRRALRFRLKTTIGGTSTLSASNVDMAVGQWSFVAAVYTGWRMQIYHNGQLASESFKIGWVPGGAHVLASIGNPPPGSPRAKFLRDLQRMKQLIGVDYLPLTAAVTGPVSRTSAAERSLIVDELALNWVEPSTVEEPSFSHPGKVSSYQLYPGGKQYSVPALSGTLQNETFGPDPETNPLGFFYRQGNVDVRDNVSLTGTMIVHAHDSTPDLELYGRNVRLQPVTLPTLGDGRPAATLPTVVIRDDFRVHGGADAQLQGLVATWGDFGFPSGSQDTRFQLDGRAVVNEFYVEPRSEWQHSSSWWERRAEYFYRQLAGPDPVLFFPQWLQATEGLDPQPRLVLRPPQANESYHWPDWSQPIFAPHPDDGGLRWELLAVRDLR